MLKECSEVEDVFFNIDKIKVEDVITKINLINPHTRKKEYLYTLLKIAFKLKPFHKNQIEKIAEFLSSKYNDSVKYILKGFNNNNISFPKDSIEFSILNNDFERFLSLSTDESILKKKIENSFIEYSPLNFSAFCGNIQVFNHLLINGFEITEKTIVNAVKGGNLEIIEIIKQKGFSLEEYFYIAVEYHRNDIAKWIYEENSKRLHLL